MSFPLDLEENQKEMSINTGKERSPSSLTTGAMCSNISALPLNLMTLRLRQWGVIARHIRITGGGIIDHVHSFPIAKTADWLNGNFINLE